MARHPAHPPMSRPPGGSAAPGPPSGPSRRRRVLAAADRFWADERRAGALLVVAAAAAVAWASSPWAASYRSTWSHPAGLAWLPAVPDVQAWIDDAAMTVFFLVIGLEIGRERAVGALASWRRAVVPAVAALGGMAGAALVYVAVLHGGRGAGGWGVPMATDIALVAGVAAALGDRVPARLRLFLVTLAVADDVASVVVLAVVSGRSVSLPPLAGAVAVIAVLLAGRRRWCTAWPSLVALVPLWIALARAGVEPALAGAVVGALAPVGALTPAPGAGTGPGRPLARAGRRLTGPRLERVLHPVSAVVVLPLFALANVGVDLRAPLFSAPGAAGVFAGVLAARVLGKTAGVAGAARMGAAAVRSPHAASASAGRLVGGAALCGAGFTVPLLFAGVAFAGEPALLQAASAGLLAGSVAAAGLGSAVLLRLHRTARPVVAPAGARAGAAGPGDTP